MKQYFGWILVILLGCSPMLAGASADPAADGFKLAPGQNAGFPAFDEQGNLAPAHTGEHDNDDKIRAVQLMLEHAYADETRARQELAARERAVAQAKSELGDAVAEFNRVLVEHDFASFEELEARRREYPSLYASMQRLYEQTVVPARDALTAAQAEVTTAQLALADAEEKVASLEARLIALLGSGSNDALATFQLFRDNALGKVELSPADNSVDTDPHTAAKAAARGVATDEESTGGPAVEAAPAT